MAAENSKWFQFALIGAGAVLCVALGFVVLRGKPGKPSASHPSPTAPVAEGGGAPPAVDVMAAPAPAAPTPRDTPESRTFEAELTKAGFLPLDNGCKTEVAGTEMHIVGVSTGTGWGNWNGIKSRQDYPAGDFIVSVDLKMAKFAGANGNKLTYLRAASNDGMMVAILYNNGYQLQAWTSPQRFVGSVRPFGDEATAYHHLKLQYEAASQTATGWVDDKLIGKLSNLKMQGNLCYWLGANTDVPGMNIDLYYDHFKAVAGAAGNGLEAPVGLP